MERAAWTRHEHHPLQHRFRHQHTIKAVAFGAVAAVVLGLGIARAEGQREMRASIVTLDPMVISVKREQLPTVYITGRRDSSSDSIQIASAQQGLTESLSRWSDPSGDAGSIAQRNTLGSCRAFCISAMTG